MQSNPGTPARADKARPWQAWREPIAVTINETCQLAGIGRTTAYKLIRAGHLQTATIGRRRLVIVASITRLLLGRSS